MKKQVNWAEFFNSHAEIYDKEWGEHSSILIERLLGFIETKTKDESILKESHLLDIGCGTGNFLYKAREKFPRVKLIGIDPADLMLHKCKEKVQEATLYCESVEELSLDSASIDIAVSVNSMGHWDEKNLAFSKIQKTLKPGGWLFMVEHLPASRFKVLQFKLFAPKVIIPKYLSQNEICDLLENNGFINIKQFMLAKDNLLTFCNTKK